MSRLRATAARLRVPPGVAVALAVGLLVRLLVSQLSVGSSDVESWERFGRLVSEKGLLRVYAEHSRFNHPPLMGYLVTWTLALADATGVRFAVLLKLPSILASVAAAALVWRDRRLRTAALLLLALNPADVLVSAYHGNTDSLCAALAFLSAFLLARGRAGLAGLALAAALNVKLLPVVLVPPFLAAAAPRTGRFAAGVLAGAIPFLPVLALEPAGLVSNVLGYGPVLERWGTVFLIVSWQTDTSAALLDAYRAVGKYLVLAASVALALAARPLGLRSPQQLGALALSVVLVLAPGFGIQYVIYPIAFLVAHRPRRGLEYAWLAGTFAACLYLAFWDGAIPAFSPFRHEQRVAPFLPGLFAWYLLVQFVAGEIWKGLRSARAARA